MIDFAGIWTTLFGGVDGWLGLDWGFWGSMLLVALIVVVENIVFWGFKPLPIAAVIKAQEAEDDRKEKEAKAAMKAHKNRHLS